MFYVIGVTEDNNYKVLDTKDGIVEEVSLDLIKEYIELGLNIAGVSQEDSSIEIEVVSLPDLNYSYNVDAESFERTVAIVVIDGKIYEDTNHQFAMELFLAEQGRKFFKENGVDLNKQDDIQPCVDITYSMFENCEAYGFDVYDNMYLIAHFEDNLKYCYGFIKEYADRKGYILGVFTDYNNDIASIVDGV